MPAHGVPRPLADAPVVALGEQATLVAQAWLVELVASLPLDRVHEVDTGAIARLGPALCDDLLATLSSDEALESLPAAATPLIAVTGGGGAASLVAAVEALRRAAWLTATAALPHADAALLAALGDRLAHACSRLTQAALDAGNSAVGGTAERLWPPRPAGAEREHADPPPPEPSSIDDEPSPPSEPSLRLADPPAGVRAAALRRPSGSLWREALERRLAEGTRCALLLIELDGAEQLEAAGHGPAIEAAARQARGRVRRGDLVAQEPAGRLWVVAGDGGRGAARALARRLTGAIAETMSLHGAPLRASTGIALFPDDGRDPAALIDVAEEAMFAARADGRGCGDEDAG